MNWKYSVLPEARQEFLDAVDWYTGKGVKVLELRFAEAVQQAIARMLANPFSFAIRYRNVRIVRTRVFSYVLHFLLLEQKMEIMITAIVYEGRAPEVSKSRGKLE